ncbi:phage protein NinX family protein [Serratia ureilytica]|uniref:phage protein NinX family protein n=1 Tax=Serratia ureilytica TaxID=300181 RepID=UPI0018D6C2D2|nr:phage protein NinX family protein [Serratia ureilytica]MBH3006776.1 DUF2591 family protein [Serratia ureilytica]
MTDYSKMSDYEINWRVAEESGLSVDHNATVILPQTYCGHDENGCKYEWGMRDYCNNPADAWPIIVEHGISLYHDNSNWQAEMTYDAPVGAFGTDETCSKFVDDKNPLRAAMIAFLMMKDVEKC